MTNEEKEELKRWVYEWFPKVSSQPSREYYGIQELVIQKVIELATELTTENDNLNAALDKTKKALTFVIENVLDAV